MKKVMLALAVLSMSTLAHAALVGEKPPVCREEADKLMEQDHTSRVEQARKDQEENLGPDEEVNEDALPTDPNFSMFDDEGNFIYEWGENEECVCGVTVKAEPSQDAKSCKVEVDEDTYSCDCG